MEFLKGENYEGIEWRRPGTPQTKDTEAAVEERKSDATSKETVRDAEDDEQGSNARDQRSVPTPDGAPDARKGSRDADRSDEGGPM